MSVQPHLPANAPAGAAAQKPSRSAVEAIKENSRALRGTIGEELQKDSDHFSEQDKQLLKVHGTYQQEDRDARKTRRGAGLGKHYMFMVRCKIPGGRLTAAQYLAMDGWPAPTPTAPCASPPGRASSYTASSRVTSRTPSPGSTPAC